MQYPLCGQHRGHATDLKNQRQAPEFPPMPGPAIPERELRSIVRRRIGEGALPVIRVVTLTAGYGRDHACAVCSEQIVPSQAEYEVLDPLGKPLRFHIKCFSEWQLECAQRIEAQSGSPGGRFTAQEPDEQAGGNGTPHRCRAFGPAPQRRHGVGSQGRFQHVLAQDRARMAGRPV